MAADFAKFDGIDIPASQSNLASDVASDKPIKQSVTDAEAAALTEPVCTTICKELKRICVKLRYVLFPFGTGKAQAKQELRNWDLWGPLIFCLLLSM